MLQFKNGLVYICLFSLLILSCHKNHDPEETTDINGEWIWVQSYGSIAGWTLTPESEGYTMKLIIDDSKFRQFRNDSLILETTYELGISEEPQIGTVELTYIAFPSSERQAIVVGATTLELYEQCFDCYDHKYSRN